MNLKDHPTVVVVTLVIAVAGLFWNIGATMRSDRIQGLETQIRTLSLDKDLKLPTLLDSLRSASDALTHDLAALSRIPKLEAENADIKTACERQQRRVAELQASMVALSNDLATAISALNEYQRKEGAFSVKKGQSFKLPGRPFSLGVLDVDSEGTFKGIWMNNPITMPVGGSVSVTNEGDVLTLVIDKVEYVGDTVQGSYFIKSKQ